MPKFSKEWEQEFNMLKEMQENRMHSASGKQCVDRCTAHLALYTNALLPHESGCIAECLAKRAQAAFIVAANVSKFEEMEHRAMNANKGRAGWF